MLRHLLLLLVLLVLLLLVSFLLRWPLLGGELVVAVHLMVVALPRLIVLVASLVVLLTTLVRVFRLVWIAIHLVLHAAAVLVGAWVHVLVIVLLLALEGTVMLLELLRFTSVIVLALWATDHTLIVVRLVV